LIFGGLNEIINEAIRPMNEAWDAGDQFNPFN